jgi:hypothetical protein
LRSNKAQGFFLFVGFNAVFIIFLIISPCNENHFVRLWLDLNQLLKMAKNIYNQFVLQLSYRCDLVDVGQSQKDGIMAKRQSK